MTDTYAIDTLPRPSADDTWQISDMLTVIDDDTFYEVTALYGFGAIVALIPEDGHLRGITNMRAIAALPQWIAEAERWRRVAKLLTMSAETHQNQWITDAYEEAGEG